MLLIGIKLYVHEMWSLTNGTHVLFMNLGSKVILDWYRPFAKAFELSNMFLLQIEFDVH